MKGNRELGYRRLSLVIAGLLLLLAACKSFQEKQEELPDNAYKGRIVVSADESFKPIIDEMVQVYESQHSSARIVVHYKPEAECLQDMLTDSVRMIIATRTYNEEERALLVDSMKVSPRSMV
ncbi:MAG: hypothetical protein ABI688_06475, partial [Bacteroidota bacterium]